MQYNFLLPVKCRVILRLMLVRSHFLFKSGILLSLRLHLALKTEWDEMKRKILILLHARILSPAKADLLPTDGGSSAHSDPPVTGLPLVCQWPYIWNFYFSVEENSPKLLPPNAFPGLTMPQKCIGGQALLPWALLKELDLRGCFATEIGKGKEMWKNLGEKGRRG